MLRFLWICIFAGAGYLNSMSQQYTDFWAGKPARSFQPGTWPRPGQAWKQITAHRLWKGDTDQVTEGGLLDAAVYGEQGWAWIACPPLLHPAFLEKAAESLGISPSGLEMLLLRPDDDGQVLGPEWVHRKLSGTRGKDIAGSGYVTWIPVPVQQADRLPRNILGNAYPDAFLYHLQRLVIACKIWEQHPDATAQQQAQQELFAAWNAAQQPAPGNRWQALPRTWQTISDTVAPYLPENDRFPAEPESGAPCLLVQHNGAISYLDGQKLNIWQGTGWEMKPVFAWGMLLERSPGILTLTDEAWYAEWDTRLHQFIQSRGPGPVCTGWFAPDAGGEAVALRSGTYPGALPLHEIQYGAEIAAFSAAGDYVWLQDMEGNGGIYACSTGLPVISARMLTQTRTLPLLHPDGSIGSAVTDDFSDLDGDLAAAFVLREQGSAFFAGKQFWHAEGGCIFSEQPRAAAFHPTENQLWLLMEQEILGLSWQGAQITVSGRIPLPGQ